GAPRRPRAARGRGAAQAGRGRVHGARDRGHPLTGASGAGVRRSRRGLQLAAGLLRRCGHGRRPRRAPAPVTLFIELVALLATALLAWAGTDAAVAHAIAKGAESTAAATRTAAEVHAQALRGTITFAAGVVGLALGRFVSARRGRVNVPAPVILPAMCAAAALGLALQMGYGDPLHWQFWPGPEFAKGFGLAALAGTVILLLPWDPVALTRPFHAALPVLMVGVFVALAIFG